MRNKEVFFWTIVIALIGAGILFISLNKNQSSIDVKNTNVITNIISASTSNVSIKPKTVSNISQTKSYSLSDVSKHNNQSSCWTIVDGKIYNITSFISSHPAGVQKILQGCGIDATNLYGRVGAHDVSKLSSFIVGNLK